MESLQSFASTSSAPRRPHRRLRRAWETIPAVLFAVVFFVLGIVVLAREVGEASVLPHSDVGELRVDVYNRYRLPEAAR